MRSLPATRSVLFSLGVAVALLLVAPFASAQDNDPLAQESRSALKDGDFESALAGYTLAIQKNPQDAKAYFKRAFVYMKMARDDEAIADLTQAIQISPQYQQAYFRRALVYMTKGNYDLAIADLNQDIQLNPKYMEAYYRRACVLMLKGEDDQAISDLSQAIDIDPNFTQAYLRRSYAYMLKGDYAQAVSELNQIIESHPTASGVYNRLAWLLATCPQASFRDGKKAVEDATKACNAGGWGSSAMLDTLAAAYAESGDFVNAIKWENEAISRQKDPDKAGAQQGRLALYQAYKPYHVEKYDPKFDAEIN